MKPVSEAKPNPRRAGVIHFAAEGYLMISYLIESVSIQTLPLP
jgi:hypothetical protein